ncbi:TPA: hypothetical protein ACPKAL_002666 [Vibrio alginolyticus]|uniref:PglD-related sugar-binding protein n=1 Tax=Vibrio TaxID=662 RepID=UPI00063DA51F|nr:MULTISPECIES: hypothetical protein [Vibrio]KLI70633.1 hypothetical protein AAW26_20440 [Vibrio alginolyticus]MDM4740377.1 hypothetical protein [Vibrio alginolyticus]MDM4760727.1 hypothetical protein [Vibrio alginolyticus]MDW2102434.1 hypothetical protein [Vibrio sp. 1580]
MAKIKVIIYGLGDFAKFCLEEFEGSGLYEVIAFTADHSFIKENEFCNKKVYAFEDIQAHFPPETYKMFVAVGYSKMRNRVIMYKKAKEKQYRLINYISANSDVSRSVLLGDNNLILNSVILEQHCHIGSNNIIWSRATLCHDSIVGDHNFIASGVIVGGRTEIKSNCFFGFSSTLLQDLIIEDETLVGAKSLVQNNSKKYEKLIGIPAQVISYHEEDGIVID